MLTGTFAGTMIMSACVVLAFILLQPYVYWKFIFDKSQLVKMIYVLTVNALTGLFAILFAYRDEQGVYIDNRLAPVLIVLIGGRRYPQLMPFLIAFMIAVESFALSANVGTMIALASLIVVAIVQTVLNTWLRDMSFAVRLWTHALLGSLINVLILGVSGLFQWDEFINQYALTMFLTNSIATVLMGVVYEVLYKEIESRNRLLSSAATDHLTGLANRRALDEYLSRQVVCAEHSEDDLSIAILDIDFFKRVNDTYGHEIGDQVLKKVAMILKENVRQSDLAGRYGGEEFVIIFPHLGKGVAYEIVERIRNKIEDTPFMIDQDRVNVTISCGLASLSEASELTLKVKADQRLYLAKSQGRNRTINEGG